MKSACMFVSLIEEEKERERGAYVNFGPFLNWNHEVKRRRKPP